MVYSENFSFDGFSIIKSIKGNWKSIKETLKLLAPGVMTMLTTNNPELAVVVGIIAKPLLDAFEYWLKSYDD